MTLREGKGRIGEADEGTQEGGRRVGYIRITIKKEETLQENSSQYTE